jgi:hypothetical protein
MAMTEEERKARQREYARKYRESETPEQHKARLAQCREYRQRPEVRERKRKYQRVYQQRPDVRDRQRDRQRQHYQQRPEVRQRQRERALAYRLRREVSDRERDRQRYHHRLQWVVVPPRPATTAPSLSCAWTGATWASCSPLGLRSSPNSKTFASGTRPTAEWDRSIAASTGLLCSGQFYTDVTRPSDLASSYGKGNHHVYAASQAGPGSPS